jgi:hypothetical protein
MRNLSKEILFCTAIVSGAVVFFIIGMGPIRAQGPPISNPGQPFAEILAQIGILNDKLNELLAKDVDLRGVAQNWDKKLDSTNGDANGCNSERFTCLWPIPEFPDGTAVRDNETGLVWERSPAIPSKINWHEAIRHCANLVVANRKGWALPLRE